MTRDVLDVLVVGAGPAGAVIARELARAGRAVRLVDKARFPRDKVCGGCLGVRGEGLLLAAGFALPDGPRLRDLRLRVGPRRVSLELPGGRVLSRAALDTALLEQARAAGADVRTGVAARLGPLEPRARVVHVGQESARARLVLAADGLAGTLLPGGPVRRRSRVGLGARLDAPDDTPPPGVVEMLCGPGGYVGLARDEAGRLDVAAAVDPGALRELGPAGLVDAILASAGRRPLPPADWRGTPALTRGAPPARERVLPLGDAAGYVEPFTGEGMTWAVASALALAPLAAGGWRDDLPPRWERARRAVVRPRACRLMAGVLRRPRVLGGLVALLGRAPALGAAWARAVHRP